MREKTIVYPSVERNHIVEKSLLLKEIYNSICLILITRTIVTQLKELLIIRVIKKYMC